MVKMCAEILRLYKSVRTSLRPDLLQRLRDRHHLTQEMPQQPSGVHNPGRQQTNSRTTKLNVYV